MWAQRGPGWALPFRWLTQKEHYECRFFRMETLRRVGWRSFVAAIGVTIVVLAALVVAIMVLYTGQPIDILGSGLVMTPQIASTYIFRYYLPGRIAIMFLSYSFDYLPHRPAMDRKDPFKVTKMVRGLSASFLPNLDLVIPLLGQSDHLVHHLWPSIPWYRYRHTHNLYASEFAKYEQRSHVVDSSTPWGRLESDQKSQ